MFINAKPAKVAKNWSGHHVRSEPESGDEEGDAGELVPARDVRFTGVMLTKRQFEKLVGEHAYNAFFDDGKKPAEPAFISFSTIWLDDVYTECECEIEFGVSAKKLSLEGAKMKNISVKPSTGGVAELAFTLVASFPRDLKTLDFEAFAGKEVTLSLSLGDVEQVDERQAKMDLDQPAEGTPIDKTRVLEPGQAEREDETQRQLGEALRGLDGDKEGGKRKGKNSSQPGAH